MFDNELPSLPVYVIGSDVEGSFGKASNDAFFVLRNGVNDVVCVMKAKEVIEKFDVCPQGKSPDGSVDRDFKYLQVVENIVSVDQSDIDLVSGQKIELTETQFNKLNEYLKDKMVMV